MRVIRFSILLAVVFSLPTAAAMAETQYVSDQLIITLRAGKGDQYPVLKTLKTDTAVEVLGEEGAYLKVREPEGSTGYVLKQYITRDQPKPAIIARLRSDLDKLEKDLGNCRANLGDKKQSLEQSKTQYQEQLEELRRQVDQLEGGKNSTTQDLDALRAQYEDLKNKAQNVLQLARENERLTEEHSLLSQQNQKLREQNEKLMMRGIIHWFLAGGGVFFFGWICGKISRRKRGGYLS